MSSPAQLRARRLLLLQYSARLPLRSSSFEWPAQRDLLAIQTNIIQDLDLAAESALEQKDDSESSSQAGKLRRRRADQQYEKSFFRSLISQLEQAVSNYEFEKPGAGDEEEVDGDILEHYTSLMSSQSSQPGPNCCPVAAIAPQASYVTYYYPANYGQIGGISQSDGPRIDVMKGYKSISLREEGTTISRGTTGLKTWEASLRLAAHLLADPEVIISPRSRVLELGSGVGLLGVLCSQLQLDFEARQPVTRLNEDVDEKDEEPQIWLSDVEGAVLNRLEETLDLNNLTSSSKTHLVPLNWIEVQEALSRSSFTSEPADISSLADPISSLDEISPSIIVAADVVFSPELLSPLCSTLKRALQAGSRRLGSPDQDRSSYLRDQKPKALVASTVRNQETYGMFLSLLGESALW